MSPGKPIAKTITDEMRRKHRPESGALYKACHNSHGRFKIKTGDIVMIVSEGPFLRDKTYKSTNNGQGTTTVVREWVDLVILWDEKLINMDGAREHLWYNWFKRVS